MLASVIFLFDSLTVLLRGASDWLYCGEAAVAVFFLCLSFGQPYKYLHIRNDSVRDVSLTVVCLMLKRQHICLLVGNAHKFSAVRSATFFGLAQFFRTQFFFNFPLDIGDRWTDIRWRFYTLILLLCFFPSFFSNSKGGLYGFFFINF